MSNLVERKGQEHGQDRHAAVSPKMIVDVRMMHPGAAETNTIALITDIDTIGSEMRRIIVTDREDVLVRETTVRGTDTGIIDREVGVLSGIRLRKREGMIRTPMKVLGRSILGCQSRRGQWKSLRALVTKAPPASAKTKTKRRGWKDSKFR